MFWNFFNRNRQADKSQTVLALARARLYKEWKLHDKMRLEHERIIKEASEFHRHHSIAATELAEAILRIDQAETVAIAPPPDDTSVIIPGEDDDFDAKISEAMTEFDATVTGMLVDEIKSPVYTISGDDSETKVHAAKFAAAVAKANKENKKRGIEP